MRQEAIQKAQAAPKQQTRNLTGIPTQMKLDFERHSGLSFDDVRVHYHSDKPARLGALAYTQGTQVHIGPGQERYLRHELGHVIQQKLDLVRPTGQRNGVAINDAPGLERAADHLSSLPRLKPSQDRPERQVYRQSTLQRAAAHQSQPVQMVSDEELEIILKKRTRGRRAQRKYRENLGRYYTALKEYWENYHTKGLSFEEWKEKLDFYKATDIIYGKMRKPTGTVLTIGDQGLATARRAQRRGFHVIATALDFNDWDPRVQGRLTKLQKDPDFKFINGMRLMDDGSLNGRIPSDFDQWMQQVSRAIFDHPYTQGIATSMIRQGDENEVAALCRSFFEFARRQKIPKIQMTVRGVDHRGRSKIGVYQLYYPGFYLYQVQRSQAEEHLTTNPNFRGQAIVPREQSLVLKYVNLPVYFDKIYKAACALVPVQRIPKVELLRALSRKKYDKRAPKWLKGVIRRADYIIYQCGIHHKSIYEYLFKQKRTSLSPTFNSFRIAENIVSDFTRRDYREEVEEKFLNRTGGEFMSDFSPDPKTEPPEVSE